MGTITGQELADNAAGLIHDTGRIRWTNDDWLLWLNDAQREAVIVKPDVYTVVVPHLLTPDSTRQTLPADGLQLFSIVRNMGADGLTPGRVVRVVSRDVMDNTDPDWHTDSATGEITNFMYDPRAPKQFYVYPQAPATDWYVEMVHSAIPTPMASLSSAITLDDVYANALLNYMLYRAHSRDEVYGEVGQAADKHFQLFMQALGAKMSAQTTSNPNLTTAPYSPDAQAAEAKPA